MSLFDKLNEFWEELKKRNVVRAFTFYCVSAWLVIQFAATVFDPLGFPEWATTVVIYGAIIGAPIVLIVSWVYEMTTEGLKKTDDLNDGESPDAKPVNTSKVLNRLTIIVLALAVVVLLVDKAGFIGSSSSSSLSGKAIAIFPFSIQGGADIQYWNEGMIDLISSELDGIPGINATDPNILISAVRKANFDSRDPKKAAEIAKSIGANRVVLGSMTQLGEKLQIRVSKYNELGEPVGKPIVEEGTSAKLDVSVDNFIRKFLAEELNEMGSEFESNAILTTNNMKSITPFLLGQQQRRQGKYREALESFKEAIHNDTTFTLAYRSYLEAAGWVNEVRLVNRQTEFYPYQQRLRELAPTLSGKQKELAEAEVLFYNGEVASIDKFKTILEKYGESRETLVGLGEAIFHLNSISGGDMTEAKQYFDRLIEIDPTNDEYLNHSLDIAAIERDLDKYEDLLENQVAAADDSLLRVFGLFTLQDTVEEDELNEFRQALLLSEIQILPFKGPREDFFRSVNLIGRIIEGSTELQERFGLAQEQALKGLSGQHDELLKGLIPHIEQSEYIILDGMSWGINSGYPENPNIGDNNDAMIELHRSLMDYLDEPYTALSYYAISMSYLNMDDQQNLNRMLSTFRSNFNQQESFVFGKLSEMYRLMDYNIEGMRSYLKRDFEQAQIFFDSAVNRGVSYELGQALSRSRNIYLAENLMRQERNEEALQFYLNYLHGLSNGYLAAGATWGFSMFRIAQLHDKLGNKDEAIEYYKEFVDAYKLSDDRYQVWVSQARERLTALGARS